MTQRLLLVVVVVAGASTGCPQIEVPRDAVITCSDADDVCPAGFACDVEAGRCVDSGATRELVIDDVIVGSPALIGVPYVEGADGAFHAEVIFNTAPSSVTRAWLAGPDDVVVTELTVGAADDDDDKTFTVTGDLDRTLPEGRAALFVEAVDDRRIARRLPGDVFVDLDFTAPTPARASISRLPDPRLSAVALDIVDPGFPVGPAVAVQVSFVVDEPVLLDDREPTLELVGSPLPLRRRRDSPSPLIFDADWPAIDDDVGLAALEDGTFALQATVTDLAGNTSVATLRVEGTGSSVTPAALTIDVSRPEAPAVDADGAVVLERAPWGRAGADGLDIHTVVGAVGSVEGTAIVRVTRDADGLREIGRFTAENDGRFGGLGLGNELLATGDLAVVYVAAFDRAGNRSAVVEVKDVTWIASPGGKVSGDTLINPHRFETLPILATTLHQGAATELDGDDIAAEDDVVVSTAGAGSFSRVGTTATTLDSADTRGVLVDTVFGHDPVRGFSVLFGGRQTAASGTGDGTAVGCSDRGTADLFIRRGDDDAHWQRFVPDDDAAFPPALVETQFVFDSARNELLLIGRLAGGPHELWDFDGARFSRRPTPGACGVDDTVPDLQGASVAFDLARQVLVALREGGTWELDGGCWQARCVGSACGAASGSLIFDDERRAVVSFNSSTSAMASWDGVAGRWQPLCVDEACTTSRPPPRGRGSVAFDRRRGEIVLFGGEPAVPCSLGSTIGIPSGQPRPAPMLGDTWRFDGSIWRQGPAVGPPPRSRHAFGYDATRGVVVVVAGDDCSCLANSNNVVLRGEDTDTWEFDGTRWQRVDPVALPVADTNLAQGAFVPVAPPRIRDHRMTSDPAREAIMLYGDDINDDGIVNVDGTIDSLYLFKGGQWFRAMVNGDSGIVGIAANGVSPVLPGLVTAPDGEIFVLGGGRGRAPLEFRPVALVVAGRQVTTACDLDGSCGAANPFAVAPPSPTRPLPFGQAMVHDDRQLVMFGGVRVAGGTDDAFLLSANATDEVYTFTRDTGWRRRCAAGESCGTVPSARVRALMAPTGVAGETLLHGGAQRAGGFDSATYLFDGATFTKVETPTMIGRQEHLLVFDPERRAVMMSSGIDENFIADDRGGVFVRALEPALDVVWEWNDGVWHASHVADVEGDGRPAQRYGAAAAADPQGGIVIHGGTRFEHRLFGMANATTPRFADTWRWRGGSDTRPAHRFVATTVAARIADDDKLVGGDIRWVGTARDSSADVPIELLVWDGGAYRALPTIACGAGCATATIDASLLTQAVVGTARELVVVAAPHAVNGLAPGYASVTTDSVELRVRYRRE